MGKGDRARTKARRLSFPNFSAVSTSYMFSTLEGG
jgi:hypothetical protein